MISEEVPTALAGERVDRAVAFLCGCTRAQAAELVAAGGVRRNQRVVRKGADRLQEGDELVIDDDRIPQPEAPSADASLGLDVRFEDDAVVVVHKPAGLVVHPGAGTPQGTLVNALLDRYPGLASVGDPSRPGIVHRLDKGTSGLLMVARTEEARASLVDQLASRSVERRYLAVACDHLESDRGLIDAPLGRDRRHPTRMAVVADGRDARTHYTVQRRATTPGQATVLECRLETGRTHQIRVHLKAIGHPVLGDALYGGVRDNVPFERPALHAAELVFTHPSTGERLAFVADPPDDLARLLDLLV